MSIKPEKLYYCYISGSKKKYKIKHSDRETADINHICFINKDNEVELSRADKNGELLVYFPFQSITKIIIEKA